MIELTKKLFEDLYFNKKLTQKEIAKQTGHPLWRVEHVFKTKLKLQGRKRLYSLNETKITKKNPEMWYFLGIFAADGWFAFKNKRVSLTLKTKGGIELVHDIAKYFEYSGPVYNNDRGATLSISSKVLYNWLLKYKMPPQNKTFKLDLRNVNFENETNFKNFMRGFYDGDGCLSSWQNKEGIMRPRYIRILTASMHATIPMIELTNKYLNNIVKYSNPKTYHQFEIQNNDDIFTFLDWIYSDKSLRLKLKGKYYLYKITKMMR